MPVRRQRVQVGYRVDELLAAPVLAVLHPIEDRLRRRPETVETVVPGRPRQDERRHDRNAAGQRPVRRHLRAEQFQVGGLRDFQKERDRVRRVIHLVEMFPRRERDLVDPEFGGCAVDSAGCRGELRAVRQARDRIGDVAARAGRRGRQVDVGHGRAHRGSCVRYDLGAEDAAAAVDDLDGELQDVAVVGVRLMHGVRDDVNADLSLDRAPGDPAGRRRKLQLVGEALDGVLEPAGADVRSVERVAEDSPDRLLQPGLADPEVRGRAVVPSQPAGDARFVERPGVRGVFRARQVLVFAGGEDLLLAPPVHPGAALPAAQRRQQQVDVVIGKRRRDRNALVVGARVPGQAVDPENAQVAVAFRFDRDVGGNVEGDPAAHGAVAAAHADRQPADLDAVELLRPAQAVRIGLSELERRDRRPVERIRCDRRIAARSGKRQPGSPGRRGGGGLLAVPVPERIGERRPEIRGAQTPHPHRDRLRPFRGNRIAHRRAAGDRALGAQQERGGFRERRLRRQPVQAVRGPALLVAPVVRRVFRLCERLRRDPGVRVDVFDVGRRGHGVRLDGGEVVREALAVAVVGRAVRYPAEKELEVERPPRHVTTPPRTRSRRRRSAAAGGCPLPAGS